jgi:hypothetical protein
MTDRLDDRDATDPLALPLQWKQSAVPSPALCGRVLAAVDDVLASRPASAIATLDGMPWAVAATLMAALLLAPWLATVATSATGRETRRVPSLAERALAAGVAADVFPPAHSPSSYARLASPPSRVDDVGPAARLPEPFRVRRLLEGDF